MRKIRGDLAVLVLALAGGSEAAADAIIVTKAMTASTIVEVFVRPTEVRVEVEIGLVDLEAFRDLMPDEIWEGMGHAPEPHAARLSRFFERGLTLRADGELLAGHLVSIEPRDRLPRDDLSGAPAAVVDEVTEKVVFCVLDYRLPSLPATLHLGPPQEEGAPAANIGFVVYHDGLPVMDFRYLGQEEVLDLDWQDPWYSSFRNRDLRRQYDAPMSVFLYVEPFEVRTEIIARPVDLQRWVDLGLAGRATIPTEMQSDLLRRSAEFLAEHHVVEIDGERTSMSLDRVHFLRRTLRTSTAVDPPEELDTVSATLGAIFVTPTVGLPQNVTLTWDLFGSRIRSVPSAAVDEAGPLRYFLQPDDNVLRWQNFLRNPSIPTLVEIEPPPRGRRLLSVMAWLGLAPLVYIVGRNAVGSLRGKRPGRGAVAGALVLATVVVAGFGRARALRMTDERARVILGGLLTNVYRAFDYRDESTIYDTLERSVTGELLTQTYLETRRGLVLASQGGARAKVTAVDLLDIERKNLGGRDGFAARCTWNVTGAVGHWGHVHRRQNQYEAELTVEPVAGTWKITELDLLQEERI